MSEFTNLDQALCAAAVAANYPLDSVITVDVDTREITIPEGEKLFGVEDDEKVEIKHIKLNKRYIDGNVDLSQFQFRISYENANGDKNYDIATNLSVSESAIEFDWLLGRSATLYNGTTSFIVCAVTVNTSTGKVTNEWNSSIGKGDVKRGIKATVESIGGKDLVAQLQTLISTATWLSNNAIEASSRAENSANIAAQSAAAADNRATDAENAAKAAATATANSFFGVEFTGSTSAGVRTGAAADFVFTPGTDTDAGANSFDAVYPWAGMRRCCCTLNADGTVRVNAYKGQPGYIEDGTNGEVLVEVPLFYIAGAIDVDPRISNVKMPGYRVPKKFVNADGSVKQRCYVRAFPGSIGEDGKLHSVAGAIPSIGKTIQQNLNAARLWGDKYSIGTSADAELLLYLMVVAYGTRDAQAKVMGVVNLYQNGIAVTAETTDEAAVVCAKGALEVGNIISVGTGGENSSVARYRMVTAVEAIAGDTANVKCRVSGAAFTATTAHKIWRISNGTGTANSVIASCGSPVSNTDGRHSFVFYGVENPLYGNQWRFEADYKLIDGVPYICNDTNYQWTSAEGYTKLAVDLPSNGWDKKLQVDERYPHLMLPKEVGGSDATYTGDYFYIIRDGTRIALRGGRSSTGRLAGPFYINLNNTAGNAWWNVGADLSLAVPQKRCRPTIILRDRDALALAKNWPIRHAE